MSSFLGFNRPALGLLWSSLRSAVDERDDWLLGDPAAAEARRAADAAIAALDRWPGRLLDIVGCGALTDLFTLGSNGAPDGWSLLAEAAPATTVAEQTLLAGVLADRLLGPDGTLRDLTADELLEILRQVPDSPGANAAFIELLCADAFGELLRRVGDEAAAPQGPSTDWEARRAAFASFDELAAIVRYALAAADVDRADVVQALGNLDPLVGAAYVEATLRAPATFTSDELAALGWMLWPDGDAFDWSLVDVQAAGLLAKAISRDDVAAHDFLAGLENLDGLFFSGSEPAGDLIGAATNPVTHSSDQAAEIVTRIYDWLGTTDISATWASSAGIAEDHLPTLTLDDVFVAPPVTYPAGLGAMVAAWMPFLLSSDPLQQWSVDVDPALVTSLITEHDGNMAAVRAAAKAGLDESMASLDPEAIERATYLLGAAYSLEGRHRLDEARSDEETLAAIANLVGFVPVPGPSAISALAITIGVDVVDDHLPSSVETAAVVHTGADVLSAGVLIAVATTFAGQTGVAAPVVPPSRPSAGVKPGEQGNVAWNSAKKAIERWKQTLSPAQQSDFDKLVHAVEAGDGGFDFVA